MYIYYFNAHFSDLYQSELSENTWAYDQHTTIVLGSVDELVYHPITWVKLSDQAEGLKQSYNTRDSYN